MERIFLSPPHLTGEERAFVEDALASNWVAPLGPHVEAFEREFAAAVGAHHAVATSSGTAALHLALKLAGVRPGDRVFVSTLTFAGGVHPILYEGASPVFVDSEEASWNMDPALLAEGLDEAARRGERPRAVVVAHLYGQSANLDPILDACRRHGVALVEDAAEALGATYRGASPGTFGRAGIYSFNGNKIITTSGGGMLVTADAAAAARARHWASQARDPAPHYEHSELGYNYRMSNVLAALGRAQLRALEDRVRRRRANFEFYRRALGDLEGISFMPEAPQGRSTRWLTAIEIDPEAFGATREDVRLALERANIEARPVWKPMHLQPLYAGFPRIGGRVAERLFERGLCLPSGSRMTDEDRARVVEAVRSCRGMRCASRPSP